MHFCSTGPGGFFMYGNALVRTSCSGRPPGGTGGTSPVKSTVGGAAGGGAARGGMALEGGPNLTLGLGIGLGFAGCSAALALGLGRGLGLGLGDGGLSRSFM